MRVKRFKFFYILNNMENIIEPDESFDFSNVTLAHPSGIQGGAYFTKIEYNKKPLYIQTTKSQTRQGFVKTGKKYYCDLMFDKNASTLISWFESLEEKCQKLIFEKSSSWFENSLEEADIETAFNSTIRVYKSGKYYLVRTNVRNNHSNMPNIKIYNERENVLSMSDITSETNIISILEIQGIKFTSRNFQIEIELKQMMVLDEEPMFDNCLIKSNKKNVTEVENLNTSFNSGAIVNDTKEPLLEKIDDLINNNLIKNNEKTLTPTNNSLENNKTKEQNTGVTVGDNLEILQDMDIDMDIISDNKTDKNEENISIDLEFEDLDKPNEENVNESNELKEVSDFDSNFKLDNLETIQLKKPNQVYFELYKEARNKAKLAKKSAILAYLEAKNIKKTYMLENINDSDSDFDAEIDEVSESELEGL